MTTRRAPSRIIPRAFPGIKPDEIEELIANSSVRSYPPGTILCRENVVEDRFYMILEGEAEVTNQPHSYAGVLVFAAVLLALQGLGLFLVGSSAALAQPVGLLCLQAQGKIALGLGPIPGRRFGWRPISVSRKTRRGCGSPNWRGSTSRASVAKPISTSAVPVSVPSPESSGFTRPKSMSRARR